MISIYSQGAFMDQVLCKDCLYSKNEWWNFMGRHGYRCQKSLVPPKFDLVTGKMEQKPYMNSCGVARIQEPCGPEGKLWTPKNKKDFFVFLRRV